MELCDGGVVLAFALDYIHGVTCSEVRQLRDEEAASEAEALERWLGSLCSTPHNLLLC